MNFACNLTFDVLKVCYEKVYPINNYFNINLGYLGFTYKGDLYIFYYSGHQNQMQKYKVVNYNSDK